MRACHTDPSGGTLLTHMDGRRAICCSARGGAGKEDEPTAKDDFLFGLVPTPDFLTLGGWFRYGYIWNTVGGTLVDRRLLQMRGDLAAAVRVGPVRAAAELGYASASSAPFTELAWVTRNTNDANLVSASTGSACIRRRHRPGARRPHLPSLGLRNLEHTSFVRSATRTDFNQDQQDGIAVAIAKESCDGSDGHPWQLLAAARRVPRARNCRDTGGVSVLAAGARRQRSGDARGRRSGSEGPTLRQAYGVTARASPWTPLVLLAEVDALITTALGNGGASAGHADWLQPTSKCCAACTSSRPWRA